MVRFVVQAWTQDKIQNKSLALGLALLLLAPSFTWAQSSGAAKASQNDPATQEALRNTQDLLRIKSQRDQAIKNDSNAQSTDQKVQSLAGSPENTQKVYDISAQVMSEIVAKTQGDPAKLNQLLIEAQKDPAKFLESLPAEQRAAIQNLAKDIEKQRQTTGGQR